MKHSFGDIDPGLLKKILKEAYDMGVRKVGLHTIGETFLCKDITEHIKNAKNIGYEYVYADTNGSLANRDNMKAVIEAGLDSIKFSINAGTRKTYAIIHGQDTFDGVIKNLQTCSELCKSLNSPMKIMASYVMTSQNENELENLKEIVKPYITDEIMVHPIFPSFVSRYGTNVEQLLPTNEIYQNYKEYDRYHCTMIFDRIHITYDGYLTACCQDFHYDLILADLKTTTLKDGWESPNAVRLREAHINQKLDGYLCNNCVNGSYKEYKALRI
jgi:MoaA/NifB/PqqE/SkfB family radical SAM enzyme